MNRFFDSGANNYLLAICFIFVGALVIFSIGNPYMFDRVALVMLILIGIAYYNNKDILSLFVILFVDRSLGIAYFQLPDAVGLGKIMLYSFVLATTYIFRYQLLAKMILCSLLITIPVEIYWYKTGYDAPAISYYYFVAALAVIVNYCLLMRSGLFRFWGKVRPQNFDYNQSELFFLGGCTHLVMILEYLIRHLTGLNILVFYASYEYIQQSLSGLNLMIILYYTVSHPKMLKV